MEPYKREKINERKNSYSIEEKHYILSKSHRKCGRCGRTLNINNTLFTIDHFIPINKGGSNDIENLVPLCGPCNKTKSDYIVNPLNYYKHISEHYMNELSDIYREYCKQFKWTTLNNYSREELIIIDYPLIVEGLQGHKQKNKLIKVPKAECVVKKARKRDLPQIIDFIDKYNKEYGWSSDVDDIVTDIFNKGCIFIVESKDSLIGVVPLRIIENDSYWCFDIPGMPVKYKKPNYILLFRNILNYIISSLISITGCLDMVVNAPVDDTFIEEVLEGFLYKSEICHSDGEDIKCYIMSYYHGEEYKKYNSQQLSRICSNAIEKHFGMARRIIDSEAEE